MAYSKLLIAVVFSLFLGRLSAQNYAGPVTVKMQSAGTSAETAFESSQLSCRFTPENHKLLMLVKTEALAIEADAIGKRVIEQVLLSAANRLWMMEADLSALAGGTEAQKVKVPVVITFNNTNYAATAVYSVQTTAETMTFSIEIPVSLAQLKLSVPDLYKGYFSDQMMVSVKEGVLTRR